MKKTKRPRPEENPGGDDLDDFGLMLEDRVEAVDPKATEIIPDDATLPEAKQDISKPKKKRRRKVCLGQLACRLTQAGALLWAAMTLHICSLNTTQREAILLASCLLDDAGKHRFTSITYAGHIGRRGS